MPRFWGFFITQITSIHHKTNPWQITCNCLTTYSSAQHLHVHLHNVLALLQTCCKACLCCLRCQLGGRIQIPRLPSMMSMHQPSSPGAGEWGEQREGGLVGRPVQELDRTSLQQVDHILTSHPSRQILHWPAWICTSRICWYRSE